ncbi:hypothetical protein D1J60_33685 [Streptomyces sp. W1SF4]|nr:hypothetical protein D1J60_33685 [Streptomyces sp. W1SF4]
MGSEGIWTAGPTDEAEGGRALLRTVSRAAEQSEGDAGAAETVFVVCRWCGAQEFEVVARECFCYGCCLPLGVSDGWEDGFPGQHPWRLEPSYTPLPPSTPGPRILPEEVCRCPQGHGVFETAISFTLTDDQRIRSLSVGLRCPDDGYLHLYIDNARTVPVDRPHAPRS